MKLRVISYNVLSSHLSDPSHFSTLKPEHLDPKNRLPVVLNKLEEQLGTEKRSIFCLQEVSYDWAGEFHTFFANRGYHMVTGLYGKKFNGYMGVALAWPTDDFRTLGVDISKLSDTREWPLKEEKRLWSKLWGAMADPTLRYIGLKAGEALDPWDYSRYRQNALITVVLKDRESDLGFCIGTYHMPCAFFAPAAMTIHSDMSFRQVQQIASDYEVPFILAGDFNIKPSESIYKFLTTGEISEADACYPKQKNGFLWHPTCRPMRSAYAHFSGKEPEFTNYARVQENDPFIDTLDYIFLSEDDWNVDNVLSLPNKDESGGPFPELDVKSEPSDHILIAADVSLIMNNSKKT